jgi:hypothetical protein
MSVLEPNFVTRRALVTTMAGHDESHLAALSVEQAAS